MSTRRADGRLVKTIKDERTGKRIYFYGASEREINQKILAYTATAARGRLFSEVSDEWWEEAEPKLAAQSVHVYQSGKRRADTAFGHTPIKDIKPRDIDLYLQRLAAQGLSQKTVANSRMVINLICTRAVLENDILYNPCASVKAPKNLKKAKRTAASADDEKIIKDNTDLWLFPYIALLTGMRKGEILALQWKDIDFDAKRISVTKSVYFEGNRPKLKEPKTAAGVRVVPLLDQLAETLQKHVPDNAEEYVICDTEGQLISKSYFMKLWDTYQKKTGITCTPHQLRHSFATFAFERGLQDKTIQEIIGHSQLSTTMDIYTDMRDHALDKAAALLNG